MNRKLVRRNVRSQWVLAKLGNRIFTVKIFTDLYRPGGKTVPGCGAEGRITLSIRTSQLLVAGHSC